MTMSAAPVTTSHRSRAGSSARRLLLPILLLNVAFAGPGLAPNVDAAGTEPAPELVIGVDDPTQALTLLNRNGQPPARRVEGVDAIVIPAARLGDVQTTLAAEITYIETDAEARIMDVTPDDPYHPLDWGMQTSRVNEAWATTTGAAETVIAIIDTGITETEDLTGRVLPGWDFVNDDDDPADDHGHGTQAALVAAAAGNNAIGTAGACWSCRVLPVKVLDEYGSGSYSAVAAGIAWAASHGADIINLSLGGPTSSNVMAEAIAAARAAGVTVIAATGNDGLNQLSYPAASPGVIAVAANTSRGARYSWSNYHTTQAAISAPGCLIAQDPIDLEYYWYCGTSAATPLVAGTAALLRSVAPWSNPAAIERALRTGARHLPWVTRFTADGTLDAVRALNAVTTPDITPPTIHITSPAAGTHLRGATTVSVDFEDDRAVRSVELLSGGRVLARTAASNGTVKLFAPISLTINSALIAGGTLTARATDSSNRTTETSVAVNPDNTPPSLTITGPTNAAARRGSVTVTVTTADASGVARTEARVGGTLVATSAAAPWSLTFDTGTIPEGLTTIEVQAHDLAGNTTTRTRTILIDRSTPTVNWTAPSGAVRSTIVIPISSSDSGSGIATLELVAGERVIARATAGSTTMRWWTGSHHGSTSIFLRATDRAGNTANTAPVTVTVDNVAPSFVASPIPVLTTTVTLSGTASDDHAVSSVSWWLVNASGPATKIGDGGGPTWSTTFNPTGIPAGPVVVRVEVRDTAGNLRAYTLRTKRV